MTEALQATPEPWQADALRAVATNDRVSIRSGHGVGKSTFLAWLILWWLTTHFPAKVGCTAPTEHQLRNILWSELGTWLRKLPQPLAAQFDYTAERLVLKGAETESFAVARTARPETPEAFQGLHSPHQLLIADEASGVADAIFEAGLGSMSTKGAKLVMAGNPTRPSGFFYNSFHSMRERWFTMRVSSRDVARAQGHIADIEGTYGRESNAVRVRVDGEFPTTADEQVVPLDLVEAAVARKLEPSMAYRPVWGVDVARFGDDRSALAKRRGGFLLEPIQSWHGKDTMQLTGLVAEQYNHSAVFERPSAILVDVIGMGAGVVDRLRELELPARGINVAESPAAGDRFMRLRDELWWKTRDWFAERGCAMPKDDALIAELTAPTYTITSAGRIVVESKDDQKKRLGRSPDLADAFVLTMAGGTDRLKAETLDRYRRKRTQRRATHWAA